MNSFIPTKYSTMIGSLPHKDPKKAVELVLESLNLPTWPQLPKISFLEQMHVQYTENFPGIKIDKQNEKIWVDMEKFNNEVIDFFQNFIDNKTDYFAISTNYAIGFYEFINQLISLRNKILSVKLQTIGPITFGLTLKDQNGKAILYDAQVKDTVIKNVVMKSIWQIKQVLNAIPETKKIFLFLDEPYLAAYGSAFTAISMNDVKEILSNTILEIKNQLLILSLYDKFNLSIGIHCCANTDWGIISTLDLDILSFDAHDFFNDFVLYSENIIKFINDGKQIAWGIVPNNKNIDVENITSLLESLNNNILFFEKKGVDKTKLLNNIILTPQCGLGNATEEVAKKVLKTCSDIISTL